MNTTALRVLSRPLSLALAVTASTAGSVAAGPAVSAAPALATSVEPLEIVSVSVDGGPADRPSQRSDVSGDGTVVAFASHATNLVDGDAPDHEDVFVRDVSTGTTTLVSRPPSGGPANG